MSLLRRLLLILFTLVLVPFLVLLSASILVLNFIRRLAGFAGRRTVEESTAAGGLASIIILNWNGKDLLAQGLPSIVEAVRADGRDHELIVVDNGSTDGSVEYVAKEFPQIRVVPLAVNLGFAEGNNAGAREARHDVVVFLNNDMVVDRGFLRPLLDGFGPDTFAVSSQIHFQDLGARREETGKTIAAFRRGMIDYSHGAPEGHDSARPYYPAFWAGGGSSAFHRRRFLALGGFHRIYSPAYVEDADISYRAWRCGWEVLFAPASIVHHKHRASSRRRFSQTDLQVLIQRNQFLFIWKNLGDWSFLFAHFAFLPWNCYRLARDFGLGIWRSLFQAAVRLPLLLRTGQRAFLPRIRSDKEIFCLIEKPALFFKKSRESRRFRSPAGNDKRPRILWLTAYLPHLGRHAGAGRMYQLLSRLTRDYRVTLLSFLETDDEREFLPEVEGLCEHVTVMRRTPAPRWQIFPYEPFDEFLTPQMEGAFQKYLENYEYSLIQLEYTQMGCYADKALGIPTLLTKHEVDFAACARRARLAPGFWGKVRWFYNYLQVLDREIKILRRCDAAICMTDSDAEVLGRFVRGVPIEVINTGVDLDYFVPSEKRTSLPRLVFVGAFQHLPNVDAMMYFCRDVLPLIKNEVAAVELLIVGSKPSADVLRLGEIQGVQVTGPVRDIRVHMAASSVYVVPLRLGVGIRGKILEAWAMAMPVVATSLSCAGLRIKEGGNVLVADSARDFADRVITLLMDPALRERIGTEGRRTAEEYYGWEASVRKLDSLYRQHMRSFECAAGPSLHDLELRAGRQ